MPHSSKFDSDIVFLPACLWHAYGRDSGKITLSSRKDTLLGIIMSDITDSFVYSLLSKKLIRAYKVLIGRFLAINLSRCFSPVVNRGLVSLNPQLIAFS